MSSPIDRRARYELAHVGEALGNPSRAAMVVALMGGAPLTASDLARAAGVTASTATAHLQTLAAAGVVTARAEGRHRYYALTGARVAEAVERLVTLDARQARRSSAPDEAFVLARTCYAHLAGRVAVAFWARAADRRWVRWTDTAVILLPCGREAFARSELLEDAPDPLVGSSCLDWSERVPHVAGRLGIALCSSLLARGWVKRAPGSRALRVTARGLQGFASLGVKWTG